MGFRFRKSINLGGGMRLNLNKKSAGLSFGGKGFRYSINTNGRRTASAGIPGTGLYFTQTSGGGNSSHKQNSNNKSNFNNNNYNNGYPYMKTCPKCGEQLPANAKSCFKCSTKLNTVNSFVVILLLIFFFPVGLYLMWAKTNWNKIIKIIISVYIALIAVLGIALSFTDSSMPASSSGIQSISIEEETIKLDLTDYSNKKKTVTVEFSDNGSSEILNSDFVFVFQNEDIATAEVVYVYKNIGQLRVEVTGLNAGTTKMHIESLDGAIKSNEIEIEVIGETPSILAKEETSTQTTSPETTTEKVNAEETTEKKKTTTKETTTEKEEIEFIVNTETGKFHYPSCRHVKTMNEGNKKTVKAESVKEMENKGYSPCGTCIN